MRKLRLREVKCFCPGFPTRKGGVGTSTQDCLSQHSALNFEVQKPFNKTFFFPFLRKKKELTLRKEVINTVLNNFTK